MLAACSDYSGESYQIGVGINKVLAIVSDIPCDTVRDVKWKNRSSTRDMIFSDL